MANQNDWERSQSAVIPLNQQNISKKSKEVHSVFLSVFLIPKMDCPSEERIIRLALDAVQQSVALEFDIPGRKLRVFHNGNVNEIQKALDSLNLGAALQTSQPVTHDTLSRARASETDIEQQDARVLKVLLAVNAVMFLVEISVGWLAQSTGLIADSLDMFADAAVYGLALYAVGRSALLKVRAARLSGWLQLLLACGALFEVMRRFWFGSEPISTLMMGFGLIALLANIFCLMLIAKNRDNGAHMKASWIFSANDVIANIGVILAGGLVALTGSRYPDLVIGLIIGVIVLNGARRILQLKG